MSLSKNKISAIATSFLERLGLNQIIADLKESSKIVIKKGLGLLKVNSEGLFANQIEAPLKKQVFHETSEVFLEFIEFRQKKIFFHIIDDLAVEVARIVLLIDTLESKIETSEEDVLEILKKDLLELKPKLEEYEEKVEEYYFDLIMYLGDKKRKNEELNLINRYIALLKDILIQYFPNSPIAKDYFEQENLYLIESLKNKITQGSEDHLKTQPILDGLSETTESFEELLEKIEQLHEKNEKIFIEKSWDNYELLDQKGKDQLMLRRNSFLEGSRKYYPIEPEFLPYQSISQFEAQYQRLNLTEDPNRLMLSIFWAAYYIMKRELNYEPGPGFNNFYQAVNKWLGKNGFGHKEEFIEWIRSLNPHSAEDLLLVRLAIGPVLRDLTVQHFSFNIDILFHLLEMKDHRLVEQAYGVNSPFLKIASLDFKDQNELIEYIEKNRLIAAQKKYMKKPIHNIGIFAADFLTDIFNVGIVEKRLRGGQYSFFTIDKEYQVTVLSHKKGIETVYDPLIATQDYVSIDERISDRKTFYSFEEDLFESLLPSSLAEDKKIRHPKI